MLKRISLMILASTLSLIVTTADGSPIAGGLAYAAGGGKSAGKTGADKAGKVKVAPKVAATQDNGDALSAFVTSPLFTRVTATVPSTVEAGPVFPLKGGLLCQRMTQTVKIDGQNVHASALMCRHPNGVWKIAVPPGTQDASARSPGPASPPDRADRKPSLPRPSPTGSPVAKAN